MTIEEIKSNPNLDLSKRMQIYAKNSDYSIEELEELVIASIKQEYECWLKNRTNISDATNHYLNKIKNGDILEEWENFEMICDDPLKVSEYKKYKMLEKKISDNGGITIEDFELLCQTIGFDDQMKQVILNGLIENGNIIESYSNDSNIHHK